MKMVYIVSYDLSEPGQKYETLIGKIKESLAWARLGQSAYLVESEQSAVELRNYYRNELDNNDKIYVGKVCAPAAWFGMPKDVTDWILEKVK
ncbi:MAG: hypothetical protein J6U22_05415 [Bacteroidaceae bacterium]|nr:hypothetical protein [Bacteroidaceae bacterium]